MIVTTSFDGIAKPIPSTESPLLELASFEGWQPSVLLPHLLLLESGFRQFTGTLSALLAGAVN